MSKELEALETLFNDIENASVDLARADLEEYKIIETALKEHEQYKIIEKAQTRGFYFKDYQNNSEIRFSGNSFIRVGNYLVETKPCYEVKETTLYSCYNPLQYPSPSKKVEDAHFWSWKTHLHFRIDEYGKTWALTKEELEHGKEKTS